MGFSGDGFPLVGPMPGEKGLYIAAAFQGHGMVNCLMCAKALTQIVTGKEWEELDGWFPRAYRMSEDRFAARFLTKLHSLQTAKVGPPKDRMAGAEGGDDV